MAAQADQVARSVADYCAARSGAYVERLARLVAIDSGPDELSGRDAVAEILAGWARNCGMDVDMPAHKPGLFVHATLAGSLPGRVILLGHHDTVFPAGTGRARPLTVEGSRAYGPGTADMKGGLLVALATLEALAAEGIALPTVEFVSVPDEETRKVPFAIIDRLDDATAVLVFECGRENGDFVQGRKTGAWVRLKVQGRSAHAGTEPERGRSAVLGLSREILRCSALSRRRPGLTVTAGTITGGSIPNVVPAEAAAVFDVRAMCAADLEWVFHEMRHFGTYDGLHCDLDVIGSWPGIEPTSAVRRLAQATVVIGDALGLALAGQTTGGMSDGCWTAEAGIPTIDGLGPVGGDDHSPDEYIDLGSVAPRCGLAAGLIVAVGTGLLDSGAPFPGGSCG
ncbi:MAG: M20/M25/M40 family metallo-hydrolase [Thermoleophilia bacterium]